MRVPIPTKEHRMEAGSERVHSSPRQTEILRAAKIRDRTKILGAAVSGKRKKWFGQDHAGREAVADRRGETENRRGFRFGRP